MSLRMLGKSAVASNSAACRPAADAKLRRVKARGRSHVPGAMNKLEGRYAAHLELRRLAGQVNSWRFEAIKLRLAKRTWYTPDFFVVMADGSCEFHEVKGGHWEDDARVKFKVAAEQWPQWGFVAAVERAGEWVIQERFNE
jgi:hypothetical protein